MYLFFLGPNSLRRHRRIMAHLRRNRRVNYTDRRGRNREILLGINQRIERGTKLAIEWAMIYIGYNEP
jgi:hypothetical protein